MATRAVAIYRSSDGSVLPVVAFALPVLIGFVGMALEMGSWFLIHERMQNAADSAALAAGRAYVADHFADLTAQAKATANTYSFTTANGSTVTVNRAPLTGAFAGDSTAIEVIIRQSKSRTFSAIFSAAAVTIQARAVSRANATPICILALNSAVSGAVTVSGSANVSAPACDVDVNSSSSTAFSGSGNNTTISAKDVLVHGGESLSGGATVTVSGVNQTNTGVVDDPYATAVLPTFSGCNQTNYATPTSATLNPGVYCGGINITGGTVTLNPGVYIIDRGSLSVSGGATLSCTACTIVLTSSTGSNYPTISISGGTTVSISAPTSGTTAGFAIMGDRNMPAGTAMSFTGGSTQNIKGVIYIPKARVTYAGGTTGGTNCTKIVADTFTFTGNSTFSGACPDYPGEAAKSPVTLVE